MRKPNLIIGKKQIILAGLTLVLGIAVYMNYVFSEVGDEIAANADMSQSGESRGCLLYTSPSPRDRG